MRQCKRCGASFFKSETQCDFCKQSLIPTYTDPQTGQHSSQHGGYVSQQQPFTPTYTDPQTGQYSSRHGGYVSQQQPFTHHPPTGTTLKKQPGKTMVKVVSIINIALAGLGTLGTIPDVGATFGQVFEFAVLASILGMSIAGLTMAKDLTKANLILAFGIIMLVLLVACMVFIPDEPLFIMFVTQGVLYIVGAVKMKGAQV